MVIGDWVNFLITNYKLRKRCSPEGSITNYELRITNYELRITNYELRTTNYELRITNYQSWLFTNNN
ncbi:MAG: alpha/beta hydrolase [Sphaerospermopsis sp. SIO1G1]|nr:alpha/beta hydrolase [Sphaerospermopsis sp. SIO1G1]